jgi:dTDP-4-dehydrorhamnose reductase
MAIDLARQKIMIVGGAGQLAQAFQALFMRLGLNAVALSRTECDITDKDRMARTIQSIAPAIIINCAAYNLVDMAESQADLAMRINGAGVGDLAAVCRDQKIFMVHFGTDYVFDGKKGSLYSEEDVPAPLSIYGQSKLAGEKLLLNSGAGHLLFRVSWLFGHGHQNFLYKLQGWLKGRDHVQVSTDEVSVPTYTIDVAGLVTEALRRGLGGTYHLVNSGFCSRFELAQFFCTAMRIERPIEPVEQKVFSLPAKRPAFSAMSNAKLSKDLGIAIPAWQDGVGRYCANLKGGS